MKKIKFISALTLTALFAAAQNGAYFEYKITSAKGMNGVSAVKHSEYGSLSTMTMNSPKIPGGSMVMTTLSKKENPDVFYMLNDKAKTYSEMKRNASGDHGEDNNTYTVKKIGSETINGYKCIHATVTSDKGTVTEVWNTKDIPDYAKYSEAINKNSKMGSSKREAALKDAGCEGFPVKMVHQDKEGDMTMELQKLEKKSFDKSDFEIPTGYTKSNAPGAGAAGIPGVKTQEEIMKMTPEERAKYIEELKKQYGK
ncbi:MAG TPA: DUF4412 domain-containing protein [Bacteroidia bacterium]|jgi:hypothetical protein|nr:DUF4412 domain-containing protein [Bacteroidia bacterium]